MRTEKIDMDYLLFAWQDESPDNAYYLDLENGDVKLVQKGLLDLDDLTDEIEQDRERYLYIPKTESGQLLKELDEFIKTVENTHLKRLITVTREGHNCFSSCRKVLSDFPDELTRFEAQQLASTHAQIDKWLAANFVLPIKD